MRLNGSPDCKYSLNKSVDLLKRQEGLLTKALKPSRVSRGLCIVVERVLSLYEGLSSITRQKRKKREGGRKGGIGERDKNIFK